jgi:phenylalanyl-tRNA synthetase alpha chain
MINKFLKKIEEINIEFLKLLYDISNKEELEKLRLKYFSKQGIISLLTDSFKSLSIEEKKLVGGKLQDLKKVLSDAFYAKEKFIFLKENNFPDQKTFDPSLAKLNLKNGSFHPYTLVINNFVEYFNFLGFQLAEGPILESEEYNFTALNIPDGHPARDEMDTFWLKQKGMLLRTHTSCVQVKEARKTKPPFGIICPGIVYRNEATDASHDFMFAQIEGLFVSENANLSNLLYVLKKSMRNFFGNDLLTIRARPGTFPFVEPGLEIDCECPFCENGCSVCKKTKWIEVGGAGIVHPFVMSQMGIEDKNILGWAFGMGITRLAMLKYKINDIRKLHNSYKAC